MRGTGGHHENSHHSKGRACHRRGRPLGRTVGRLGAPSLAVAARHHDPAVRRRRRDRPAGACARAGSRREVRPAVRRRQSRRRRRQCRRRCRRQGRPRRLHDLVRHARAAREQQADVQEPAVRSGAGVRSDRADRQVAAHHRGEGVASGQGPQGARGATPRQTPASSMSASLATERSATSPRCWCRRNSGST